MRLFKASVLSPTSIPTILFLIFTKILTHGQLCRTHRRRKADSVILILLYRTARVKHSYCCSGGFSRSAQSAVLGFPCASLFSFLSALHGPPHAPRPKVWGQPNKIASETHCGSSLYYQWCNLSLLQWVTCMHSVAAKGCYYLFLTNLANMFSG